jgi:hypothetical protein
MDYGCDEKAKALMSTVFSSTSVQPIREFWQFGLSTFNKTILDIGTT